MANRNRSQDDTQRQQQEAQAMLSEQTRQQLAIASEVSCVMCRAAEAMQQIQQHATQRAALRYQQMADQIRQAQSPNEVLAIQSTLVTSGMQEVAQYMHDMTTATLRIQSMLLETRRSSQDTASTAAPTATAAFSAWQSMMTGGNGVGAHH